MPDRDLPMDYRRDAPATGRNREPILSVLRSALPSVGSILELASGTGQHAVFFAPAVAPRPWLTSEADLSLHASINAWMDGQGSENLRRPIALDVRSACWPVERPPTAFAPDSPEAIASATVAHLPVSAIVAINLLHISPWEATLGVLDGATRILPPGGLLYLYGPYRRHGRHTSPGNEAFDASLRDRDRAWGIRDLEAVVAAASDRELILDRAIDMPANNLSVLVRRR